MTGETVFQQLYNLGLRYFGLSLSSLYFVEGYFIYKTLPLRTHLSEALAFALDGTHIVSGGRNLCFPSIYGPRVSNIVIKSLYSICPHSRLCPPLRRNCPLIRSS